MSILHELSEKTLTQDMPVVFRPTCEPSNEAILHQAAQQIGRMHDQERLDPWLEEVFLVATHASFEGVALLPVPNRSTTPWNHFGVTLGDVNAALTRSPEWYEHKNGEAVKRRASYYTLRGYIHTHPVDGGVTPSTDDYKNLPPGYTGGVYCIGYHSVYWYDTWGTFLESPLPQ